MKVFFEQYGKVVIVVIITSFFFACLAPLFSYASMMVEEDRDQTLQDDRFVQVELPTLRISSRPIRLNSVFDYNDYVVEAVDYLGNDIKDRVEFVGDVDTSVAGGYTGVFIVRDVLDFKCEVRCSFVVE